MVALRIFGEGIAMGLSASARASRWGTVAVAACLTIAVSTACTSRLEKDDSASAASDFNSRPASQLDAWSTIHTKSYGINATSLAAYAYAASVMDQSAPGCRIGWATLAAIGSVESKHGTVAGARVDSVGNVAPDLRALKLSDPAPAGAIPDTDGGRYDGSPTEDLPMGPMQFLPSRWEQWSTDANNDGVSDADNIDDASLSAARFLCATGGDLSTPEGWTKAVSAYDRAPNFAAAVHDQAALYGR
ncbi:MAG: lytic transglycosylase domain-containing protein [Rhodococcus sp. (in: high G+C Gram-positive bacteria)]